jgi:predicted Fe-S protein YdhL (DUF1289 family)
MTSTTTSTRTETPAQIHLHTPCIGICSTVYGDDVCRGCRRFSDEVIRWNGLSLDEKSHVLDRLAKLVEVVILDKIDRVDQDLLKAALAEFSVRYYPQHHCYTWVYTLMRARGDKLDAPGALESCGIFLKPSQKNIPTRELLETLDEELYGMSEVLFLERSGNQKI